MLLFNTEWDEKGLWTFDPKLEGLFQAGTEGELDFHLGTNILRSKKKRREIPRGLTEMLPFMLHTW